MLSPARKNWRKLPILRSENATRRCFAITELSGWARDIWEALEVCDLVERLAHIFVQARNFGPRASATLPDDAIETEMKIYLDRR